MRTPRQDDVIHRLEAWVDIAPTRVVPNNQYIEAKTLLMMCNNDMLNTKGWDEVEFYVTMMGIPKAITPTPNFTMVIQVS